MKNLSRVFALISAIIILFSSFTFTTMAADKVTYSASNVSGAKGDTVTVSVKLSAGVELWGSLVSLSYNSSELQYISSSKGSLVSMGSLNHSDSKITFAGSLDTSKSKNGGTVFTVNFKVLKSSGTSGLTVSTSSGADNCDYDGNAVPASTSNGKVTIITPVTSVTLNKSKVTLKKGETTTLSVTISPSDATDKTVTYSSSDKGVAKVDKNGKVTAVGAGTAIITAKVGNKSVMCTVTVTVSQTGIKPSGNTSRSVAVGDTLKLSVVKVPADATDSFPVSWSSSNASVAKVSSNGTVTPVSVGTTQIVAKSNNWTASFTVTVTEKTEEEPTVEDETEESTSEEISTEPEITDPTEPDTETTEPIVTEPQTTEENIENNGDTVSITYLYMMVVATAVVVAIVTGTVTFFVTKGYYGSKKREKDIIDEDY